MAQEYKVPQNIDLEDKIVGPFTMRQFIYLLIGGGTIYGLFRYFAQFENGLPYFLVLTFPIALLTAAFTFVKVNDRPFEKFIVSFFQFLTQPKQRLWQRGYQPPQVVTRAPTKVPIGAKKPAEQTKTLDELTRELNQAKVETPKPPRVEPSAQAPQPSPPAVQPTSPAATKVDNIGPAGQSPEARPLGGAPPAAQQPTSPPAIPKKGFLARLFKR